MVYNKFLRKKLIYCLQADTWNPLDVSYNQKSINELFLKNSFLIKSKKVRNKCVPDLIDKQITFSDFTQQMRHFFGCSFTIMRYSSSNRDALWPGKSAQTFLLVYKIFCLAEKTSVVEIRKSDKAWNFLFELFGWLLTPKAWLFSCTLKWLSGPGFSFDKKCIFLGWKDVAYALYFWYLLQS